MRLNLWANANTIEFQITGAKLKKAGTFINDATVTATIKNATTLEDLTGITQPIEIPYETDSDGNYHVEVPHGSNIVAGVLYRVNVFIVSGTRSSEFEADVLAKKRPFPA